MMFIKIVFALIMMSAVFAHEEGHPRHLKCGTNEEDFVPNQENDEHEGIRRVLGTLPHPRRRVRHSHSGAEAYQRFHRNLGTSTATISVAFHAIRDFNETDCGGEFCDCTNISLVEQGGNSSTAAEYLTYAQATDEIDNLNIAFNAHGIGFALGSYDVTCSSAMFNLACDDYTYEELASNSLEIDPIRNMNLYYVDCMSYGLFGYAYMPPNRKGVFLDYRSVKGGNICGSIEPCDGDTLVRSVRASVRASVKKKKKRENLSIIIHLLITHI